MKIVAVNGGPRKNCNTAQLLDSFLNGVREAAPDAEIEVIHVFGRIPYLPVLQKVQIITKHPLGDIQVRYMESVLLLHPLLDLLIGRPTFRRRHIHLIHIDLHADMILRLRKFGQKTYRLDVVRGNETTNSYLRQ